ncbi:hypothetical protein Lalb_Chr01g0013811 [Lupinus albus]|uniref:Uncharacterized protein n=1 Tax=Lupinus albus TaxID=3870 RepID=A0A6A4R5V9_LUPAL|nr:hypothetical protein Lalb_Chr01g0013811 [Lupinus albus]
MFKETSFNCTFGSFTESAEPISLTSTSSIKSATSSSKRRVTFPSKTRESRITICTFVLICLLGIYREDLGF